MRILLTNDDGIDAPGLAVLEEIAATLAGPTGDVWTVAPALEQSGVGHCVSYLAPFRTHHLGKRRFAVEGFPADCVLAALHHFMPERPDLVLSGVNRGNNSAENTLYSGTIGAAMEAALQGLPAIALSQYLGPENIDRADSFEASRAHAASLIQKLLAQAPWGQEGYGLFYNVNFPPVPAAQVKGIKASRQGLRAETGYTVVSQTSPGGRDYLWIKGGDQRKDAGEGTDARHNLEGYISVTPMTADLTDHQYLTALGDVFA